MKKVKKNILFALLGLILIWFFGQGYKVIFPTNEFNLNYFTEKSRDIVASFIASVIFTFTIASLSFIADEMFDGVIRKFLRQLNKEIIGKKNYKVKRYNVALDQVISSLDNTKLVFIRVGGFNINSKQYTDTVSNIIEDDLIWDYHIHLRSISSSTLFLGDFFEIEDNNVLRLKQELTTFQLSQIQREDFMNEIKVQFNQDITEGDFSDVIIQGTINTTGGYPELSKLDLANLNIMKVTLFFNDKNEAHELDVLNHQSVGTKFIEVTNSLLEQKNTLYVGEQALEANDSQALEIGRRMYSQQ